MISIWERNSLITFDHIVLGGGIVGLTTAYYLKKKYPAQSVIVLERGLLPSGASTKNAGFACMGSPTELLDDLTHSSEDEVLKLFILRKQGLARLRSLLGDESIGYAQNGSHELLGEDELITLEKLDYLNALLRHELTTDAFRIADAKINGFKFNTQYVKSLIENTCEGEIDTGRMMQKLIELVLSNGIEIKTGCIVNTIVEEEKSVVIHCQNPIGDRELIFEGSTVCICTNAFAKQFLDEEDIKPGRGQVLITKPITNLAFKGIFHFNKGYYYFREYKGCVIFGGGRNLDFKQEETTELAINHFIQQDLSNKLATIILPNQKFEIDMQWSGIMAFGEAKRPIVKQISNRQFLGVRMGGMGVAIGSEIGHELAEMLTTY